MILSTENLSFNSMLFYPDMSIHKGNTTFISGPSGSGKTTLLKLFNATLAPSSGRILYEGKNIDQINTITLRREIILVAQEVYLFPDTIEKNFLIFHEYNESAPPSTEEMREYLKICQGEFPLSNSCTNMSGGERQRIFLAIALSLKPKVLLLDEPTSALDAVNAHGVLENLSAFCKKKNITLIVVSHDKSLQEKFAEQIIEFGGSKK